MEMEGFTIISQMYVSAQDMWDSLPGDTGRRNTPVEPEASVTGDSDKENAVPDQEPVKRTQLDMDIFGDSDAELSISDHTDLPTLSRENSPPYVPRTPEPREPSITGSDWGGEIAAPWEREHMNSTWLEEEPWITRTRERTHALWLRLEGTHPEYCACRWGHGPID